MRTMSLPGVMKGIGRNSLDLPVAALAALATAYLAFALPPDLLARLVGSTGLPEWLPAAEPPLGNKARLSLGIVGAALIFAFVFALLRLIDRRAGTEKRAADPQLFDQAPRVRRRDAHPDAPARRPILASLDFGDPEVPEPAQKAPLWLSPAEPDEGDLAQVAAQPSFEPDPLPQAEPVHDSGPGNEPASPPPPLEGETIAQLMTRLESGLARRRSPNVQDAPVARKSESTAAPAAEAEDDRLQSAIDNLQRLAARVH